MSNKSTWATCSEPGSHRCRAKIKKLQEKLEKLASMYVICGDCQDCNALEAEIDRLCRDEGRNGEQ